MYTKKQKIDKICENRGYNQKVHGTKTEFIKTTLEQIEKNRLEKKAKLTTQKSKIDKELAEFPKTAREMLNRRVTLVLIKEARKVELEQELLNGEEI